MRRIFYTLLLLSTCLTGFSQATIEGTYLPVINTRILQVWDTAAPTMNVPTTGANQIWDFSNDFSAIVDTFEMAVKEPTTTPYFNYFPDATHASYLRSPFQLADSLWLYFEVDTSGMYNLGYFSEKQDFDSVVFATPPEFVIPMEFTYGDVFTDTSRYAGDITYQGFPAKLVREAHKVMSANGYGTLITPDATFNEVILGTEEIYQYDTLYLDVMGNGNYAPFWTDSSDWHRFHFMRNNTFATTYLMEINTNVAETEVKYGWYTLPVDFGSISGYVYDTTGIGVSDGEMYLYREHSNFTKNDILATTMINSDGSYQFDSIPYGEYRIAARPNLAIYQNAFTTYYGDTTDWVNCQTVITSGDTTGIDINILYSNPQTGTSQLDGNISYNSLLKNNDPVPGIDIIVEKDPEEDAIVETTTDAFGNFTIAALDDGNYKIWVDIPGLPMAGTYNFSVSNGTVVSNLDFEVGADEIFPSTMVSIQEQMIQKGKVSIFPNPFDETAIISLDINDATQVSIDVYDITGKLITNLVRNKTVNGQTTIALDQITESGIYLVKVTMGSHVECLRIVKR